MQKADEHSAAEAVSPAELLALQARVDAVCRTLPVAAEFDRQDPSSDSVGVVLTIMAAGGLLDLASLSPNATAVAPVDVRKMATIIERLARHSGAFASIYMVNVILGGAFITLAGSPEQKATLLPRLKSGAVQLAFAMTEPQAGSDAASLTATATRDGNDFLLNGEKIYTTGAVTADWIIVVARLAEPSAPKRALSLFLVPKEAAGLTVEPLTKLFATVHASCRVLLRDVRVGPDQVLGGDGRLGAAWEMLRVTGSLERIVVAATALGLATGIVERAVDFAKGREQFGQRIVTFQAIQHTLVEMRMIETAMRLFVGNALSSLESGGDPTEAICMAKCFCSEQLQTLAAHGMRVMGGRSCFEFEEMARYYREAPFALYAGGTVEVQKMLIARNMGLG